MSSAEMDHRAVRLALGLTIAGALMLITGVATWLITAVGRVMPGTAGRELRLASLALLAGGAVCGLAMGFALAAAGRPRPGGPPIPADAAEAHLLAEVAGLAREAPGPPAPAPSLDEPRSLMSTPLGGPPPLGPPPAASSLGPPSEEAAPADRVWWRAARSPAGGWDDTSEEWLRSLRGPAMQQPPPHSAE